MWIAVGRTGTNVIKLFLTITDSGIKRYGYLLMGVLSLEMRLHLQT